MIRFNKVIFISLFLFIIIACKRKETDSKKEFIEQKESVENFFEISIKNNMAYTFNIPEIWILDINQDLNLLNLEIDIVRKVEQFDEKYNTLTVSEFGNPEIMYKQISPNEEISYKVKFDQSNNNPVAFFIFQRTGAQKIFYDDYCNIMKQHGFLVLFNYQDLLDGKLTINKNNIFKVTELAMEDFSEYKKILLSTPEKLETKDSDFMEN